MNRAVKIFVGVIIFLGILSVIFLLTSKKQSTASTTAAQTNVKKQTLPVRKTTVPNTAQPNNNSTQTTQIAVDRQTISRSQWQQCKNKTMAADTSLFWNIQITEAIPAGGTYAKGFLDSDQSSLVHVIIKSDAQNPEQIKERLAVGKVAFVRGTCTDVASDGAVVLQAF